jgi:hypothetical protein
LKVDVANWQASAESFMKRKANALLQIVQYFLLLSQRQNDQQQENKSSHSPRLVDNVFVVAIQPAGGSKSSS